MKCGTFEAERKTGGGDLVGWQQQAPGA